MKLSRKLSNNLEVIRRLELCPYFLNIFSEKYSFNFLINDFLSGMKTFLFMLPIVLALSFFCGGSVIQGVISCAIATVISAIIGGSKYQITAIAFPVCAVMLDITSKYQYKGLLFTAVFVSAILVLFGLLRLSKVLKHISYAFISAISVFVACSIITNQIQYILDIDTIQSSQNFIENLKLFQSNIVNVGSAGVMTALAFLLPLVVLRIFLSNLVSFPIYLILGGIAAFVSTAGYVPNFPEIKTIGSEFISTQAIDNIFTVSKSVPSQTFLMNCLNYAFAIAIIIACEACFCTSISSSITGNRKLQSNMELISTGISNLVSVAFGGLFVSPNILLSVKNISQKSRTFISLLTLASLFYGFVYFSQIILKYIPIYCISSILICYAMFEFFSKKIFRFLNLKRNDSYIFWITLLSAMYFGFITSVTVGFIASLIFFSKRMINIKDATVHTTKNHDTGAIEFMQNKNGTTNSLHISQDIMNKIEIVQITNTLSLNIAKIVEESLAARGNFPSVVIIYFQNIPFLDGEALSYLKDFVKRASEKNCLVMVSGTNGMLLEILQQKADEEKTGNVFGYIIPNFSEAIDKTVKRLKAA